MTVSASLKEIAKLPEQQQQIKKSLGFEEEELPKDLQNIHIPDCNPGHEPLMVTLAINDLYLYNCMLESRAPANIMPLTIMKQLGLNITRPYKEVCGFNSKPVEVEGLTKDLKVSLPRKPDISLLMDIVVIDIPDVWGMLLCRKWGATVGGHVQMDLSYATLPQSDGTPFILRREPTYLSHIIEPSPYYEAHNTEKPSPILPSKEIRILKRPNHKPSRRWKPKKEYKIGDLVLVDKELVPVKIDGKVGDDYYYIAKLNDKLWPQPVKIICITPFLDT